VKRKLENIVPYSLKIYEFPLSDNLESMADIVTVYGLDSQEMLAQALEGHYFFLHIVDHFRVPPNLSSNGYQGFFPLGVK
jgi:hypothetical protein